MAPRGIEPRTPDFMKVGFIEHVFIYMHVVFVMIGFLLLIIALGIMYLITRVKVDITRWDMDRIIATGKIRSK